MPQPRFTIYGITKMRAASHC